MRYVMSYCPDYKRKLIVKSLKPGNSVEGIAKKYGVGRSTVFKWVQSHSADIMPDGFVHPALTPRYHSGYAQNTHRAHFVERGPDYLSISTSKITFYKTL